MSIDENKFKTELSNAFIELIDSKRGLASKLAKAIGKKPYFISGVKRGKPVNALHLKAIELVFGPGKVLAMLSPNEPTDSNKKQDDVKTNIEHQDLVTRFKNPDKGLENNQHLIAIEHASPRVYKRVSDYLKNTHETIKDLQIEQAEALAIKNKSGTQKQKKTSKKDPSKATQ